MKTRVYKDYKVNKHNSTVLGYPGREFDWSKFCWNGSEIHKAIFKNEEDAKAPLPFVDDFIIAPNCEYLHIPYDWAEQGTIYRVRPNSTMYAGEIYRGRLIKRQIAIKKKDGWYWRLYF